MIIFFILFTGGYGFQCGEFVFGYRGLTRLPILPKVPCYRFWSFYLLMGPNFTPHWRNWSILLRYLNTLLCWIWTRSYLYLTLCFKYVWEKIEVFLLFPIMNGNTDSVTHIMYQSQYGIRNDYSTTVVKLLCWNWILSLGYSFVSTYNCML